jgi:hypothetical protein
MNRPHILGLLKIAFTATCGTICTVLIAFWVRSYTFHDVYDLDAGRAAMLRIVSEHGLMQIAPWVFERDSLPVPYLRHVSIPVALLGKPATKWRPWLYGKQNYFDGAVERWLVVSYWFLVAFFGSLSIVFPVINTRRFSVRSLLVVTTLIAVVLGLVALVSR